MLANSCRQSRQLRGDKTVGEWICLVTDLLDSLQPVREVTYRNEGWEVKREREREGSFSKGQLIFFGKWLNSAALLSILTSFCSLFLVSQYIYCIFPSNGDHTACVWACFGVLKPSFGPKKWSPCDTFDMTCIRGTETETCVCYLGDADAG